MAVGYQGPIVLQGWADPEDFLLSQTPGRLFSSLLPYGWEPQQALGAAGSRLSESLAPFLSQLVYLLIHYWYLTL